MTDFVANCATEFLYFCVFQVGGEIIWCDICFTWYKGVVETLPKVYCIRIIG